MTLEERFDKAISRQEVLVMTTAYKFDDETQQAFYDGVARRLRTRIATFDAKELPGIDAICAGLDAEYKGYRITRRRVDQLDNIYVSRLH